MLPLPLVILRAEKFLVGLVFVIVITTPLVYFSHTAYPYLTLKTLLFQGLVEILFCLWVACAIFDARLRPKKSLLFLAILFLLCALFLTAATGEDFLRSMWGLEERMLGVVGFLHVGAFFVVLQSMRALIPWKKVWYASLAVAVFVSIVAFIQLVRPNILLEEQVGVRPGSFFGNPTFLAVYLLFHIFLGIFWSADEFRHSRATRRYGGAWALVGATLVIALALFITQTRGDIVGLGFGVLVFLALAAFRPPENLVGVLSKRTFYAGVLATLLLFGGVFFITRDAPVWNSVPGLGRLGDTSLSDDELLPRLTALRVAWAGFLERPLIGWGWDNFNLYFDAHYDPRLLSFGPQETRFDKPHNVFLEYLFSGGIILFGAFVFFVVVLLMRIVHIRDRVLRYALLAALVAYLVRSVFIFDTLGSLLLFVLIAAYADSVVKESDGVAAHAPLPQGKAHLSRNRAPYVVLGAALLLAFVPVYALHIRSFNAARHQYWGFAHTRGGEWKLARENFAQALLGWTPWVPSIARDYAQLTVGVYFSQRDDCARVDNALCVTSADVSAAFTALEEVSRAHSKDAYYHYTLLDLYNQAMRLDPVVYTKRAEEEARLALERSPNRQQIYFSLAKTKLNQRNHKEALALLEQGIALAPDVPDGHFYYGLVLFDAGDAMRGYAAVQRAVALGKRWASPSEPIVAGDFFVDAGYTKDAISLYEAALTIDPRSTNAKAGIAIALFRVGARDRARVYIEEVARTADLTSLSSYSRLVPLLRELGVAP